MKSGFLLVYKSMTHGTRFRWLICALLFFATTINYIDRQILSLVKPILDQQLHWTDTQFGYVNSVFQAAYALGLLGFGYFVDRIGAKMGYGLSICFWSLAAISHSLVGTITGFRIVRAFLGISEAGNFPSAIKAVSQWFPKRERAFATSIFNAGANAGPILAPAVVPALALKYGWQFPFVLAGAAGFVWLGLWLWIYTAPEKHQYVDKEELALIQSDADERAVEGKVPWITLLGYRQTWSFIVAKFLTDPVWWFFLIWLPSYFSDAKHLDLKTFGAPLVTIYMIAGVLSIFGGWVNKTLIQRGWSTNKARKVCLFSFALFALPCFLIKFTDIWGAVVIIGIAGAAHQAWSANLYTTVSDMFPKNAVASVIGIGGMAGSVGGMLFPIFTGMLTDAFKKSGHVTTAYTILFSMCAIAYVSAFALNHLLAPRFDKVRLDLPRK